MSTLLSSATKLVVSVDVEDWAQSTWNHSLDVPPHAARNTERLLDILPMHEKTVTMFVLGKFAERFPNIVRRIEAEGHEIASHGYGHIEIHMQTQEGFRQDARQAKELLEDLTGKLVVGYRAPDFSISSGTVWALDVLADLGFQYDSSIFPIKSNRYGISDWPLQPMNVRLPSGRSIVELPIATFTLFGRRWPVAGGGYHRLLPWPVIREVITRSLRSGLPFVSYCHPYEFDLNEFSMLELDIPLAVRWHQGLGRRGFQRKFERMLTNFDVSQAYKIALECEWPDYILQAV